MNGCIVGIYAFGAANQAGVYNAVVVVVGHGLRDIIGCTDG